MVTVDVNGYDLHSVAMVRQVALAYNMNHAHVEIMRFATGKI